ncbi:MAG: hypothetical protein R3F07_08735 [Opitutaceae bacterium]
MPDPVGHEAIPSIIDPGTPREPHARLRSGRLPFQPGRKILKSPDPGEKRRFEPFQRGSNGERI